MIPFKIILPQGRQVFKTQQYEVKSPIVYPQITQRGCAATKKFLLDTDEHR